MDKRFNNQRATLAGFFLILFLSFFAFLPKVSVNVLPVKRDSLLSNFLKTSIKNQAVNGQAYWEFREFYSPGTFRFSRSGIDYANLGSVQNVFPTSFRPFIFLLFNTKYLQSVDALVSFSDISSLHIQYDGSPLIQSKTTLLYKNGSQYILYFVLPNSQMQKANGFFDYKERDKTLVGNKNWLNISVIETY